MTQSREGQVQPMVVLFDGVCNLCNTSVHFIIDREPAGSIRFASLQSDAGQALLKEHGLSTSWLDSLVTIEGGRAWTHSAAALRIARRLRAPWWLFSAFLWIPAIIRDPVYRFIAARRYRWFGKQDACRIPTPELAGRFLDGG